MVCARYFLNLTTLQVEIQETHRWRYHQNYGDEVGYTYTVIPIIWTIMKLIIIIIVAIKFWE